MTGHDPVDTHDGPLRPGIATSDHPLTRRIGPLHQAQLLAYMRLLKMPVGLLLNFNRGAANWYPAPRDLISAMNTA